MRKLTHHISTTALTLLCFSSACMDWEPLHPLTSDPLDTGRVPTTGTVDDSTGATSTSTSTSDPPTSGDASTTSDNPTTGAPDTDTGAPACTLTIEYLAPDSTMCTENSCNSARPYVRASHNCTAPELSALLLEQSLSLHNADSDTWSPPAKVPTSDQFAPTVTDTCVILMWGLQHRAQRFTLARGPSFDAAVVSWVDVEGYAPGLHSAIQHVNTAWHVSQAPVVLPTCAGF